MARAAAENLATLHSSPPSTAPPPGRQEVAQLAVQHDTSSHPYVWPAGASGTLLTDVGFAATQQLSDTATICVNSP